ncbi:MAG: hypothetical protein ACREQ7_01520 [Candidatus Binatia bacterium]
MITSAELHRTAEEEGLRLDQVEKDYVLLWILRGLSLQNLPAKGWVFKGGTCSPAPLYIIKAIASRKISTSLATLISVA